MIYGTSASLLFTFVLSCGGVLLFFGRTVFGRRISDNVQGLCVRAGKFDKTFNRRTSALHFANEMLQAGGEMLKFERWKKLYS
jgi:hypothetical protein